MISAIPLMPMPPMPMKCTGPSSKGVGRRFIGEEVAQIATAGKPVYSRVKPSVLQSSLPTPWRRKNRPAGSYLAFMAARRG